MQSLLLYAPASRIYIPLGIRSALGLTKKRADSAKTRKSEVTMTMVAHITYTREVEEKEEVEHRAPRREFNSL